MSSTTEYYILLITVLCVGSISCMQVYDLPKDVKKGSTYELDASSQVKPITAGKDCTKPGYMCEDCKNVSICILIAEDTWIKEHVEVCANTCLEATGACTAGPNPDCDPPGSEYKFNCNQPGLFPDPMNCTKYHACIPDEKMNIIPESIEFTCPQGFYYNPKIHRCSQKLLETCSTLGNPCSVTTLTGSLFNNPAMYFVCLKGEDTVFYPQIFICPYNFEYDDAQEKCVDPSPIAATGIDGKCLKTGFFYKPDNCLQYYECSAIDAAPVVRTCTASYFFDHHYNTKACSPITCDHLARK